MTTGRVFHEERVGCSRGWKYNLALVICDLNFAPIRCTGDPVPSLDLLVLGTHVFAAGERCYIPFIYTLPMKTLSRCFFIDHHSTSRVFHSNILRATHLLHKVRYPKGRAVRIHPR